MHLLSVFSLRNRALIALLTIVVGVFGGIALTSLKQELFPSVTLPQLTVISSYRGASPDVVEADVSTPIEAAIQGVDGLEATAATSGAGVSTVTASFTYGTDLARAEQKIQLALNRIEDQLPAAVDPQVVAFSLSDFPIVVLGVTSDLDADELSAILRDQTIVDISNLPGVGQATLSGASGQRVTITPDLTALAVQGLSTQAIRDALDANGVLLATGVIDEGDSELIVQAGSPLASADDISALPLLGGTGESVTIGDVADVEIVSNPVTAISRVNGDPSLTISITKNPAANTVDVANEIAAALPALSAAIGANTEFTTIFNQAPFIEQSIESLALEGVLGLTAAVLVILLFLLSVRSTLVTAISIPVSVLVTFIGMLATGYTMNVLTLGALTIAIGRVVDDSIVVIENIKRHLSLGEEKKTAILSAVREVATAITASTATTVAVFLPLALVSDVTGELFRPFALTITIALLASLLVSLTIVPVLAYWFLKAPKPTGVKESAEDELDKPNLLQRVYLPALSWTVRHPVITLGAAGAILAGTVGLVSITPTNFVGDQGQNTISVRQTLPAGSNLATIDEAAHTVEDALLDIDGVEVVQVSIGSDSASVLSLFRGGADATYSITTDPDADQEELRLELTEVLDGIEGAGELSVGSGGGGFSSDLEIDVRAADPEKLAAATEELLAGAQDLDVTAQAESNLAVTQPYLAIEVDRQKAADAGLSEIAVGGIVAEAMLPAAVGSVTIDNTVLSVYITNPNAPVTVQELRDFQIPTAFGLVPLSDLATIEEVEAPATISSERGIRTSTITVTPAVQNLAVVTPAIEQMIADADLPDGVSASVGGVAADQAEGFSQLFLALLAAILIVYTIMVATFRSLRQPLLLLVSIPFAATGALLLQIASGIPFGIASIIGLLMLVGIVVTNAIVLIDLVNQYRERGMSVVEAIRHGAARRLRPILMTALATIAALLPMAIGLTGHGGFISQPLGIIVIGGLISSTALTLLVLPALYSLVEGFSERRAAKRSTHHGAHSVG
ncbi:efflux RND transporter permease subunit [Pseudolysinimonas yzui]|uniref:Multidrug transporter n=1 Tax=Pseudolysinimonas yzui TaxID=2708254 RepID=A0A8J3GSW3_9MICO|nr:efflux RND transporter permease subunit [Pseudolysinimonas yzui]GHF24854.1 multidrug transporter [Pseudolysinimonas yzui]